MAEDDVIMRQLTDASQALVLAAQYHGAAARDVVKRAQALITETMDLLETRKQAGLDRIDARSVDLHLFQPGD